MWAIRATVVIPGILVRPEPRHHFRLHRYWNVSTENGTNQLDVIEMYFQSQSCYSGYYLYNSVACLPCANGTYGIGGWAGSNCVVCRMGTYANNTGESHRFIAIEWCTLTRSRHVTGARTYGVATWESNGNRRKE